MNPFWEVADFVRRLRREMRFGELSRGPVRLLRFELTAESVSCDWLARPADIWDESLGWHKRERNVSGQALRDAISMRDLIFDALPNVQTAMLRSFRSLGAREPPELIISGVAIRETPPIFRVSSLVMRAKLCGFKFEMEDGVLQVLRGKGNGIVELMNEIHFHGVTP